MKAGNKKPILIVSHLTKYFPYNIGIRAKGSVKALDDASFTLYEGETLGIVGETGCGKTTLGRTILRLIDATRGDIYFDLPMEQMEHIGRLIGEYDSLMAREATTETEPRMAELSREIGEFRKKYSLTLMSKRDLKKYRNRMQPVFQDPFSSLDPRRLIKDTLMEPLKLMTRMSTEEILEKINSLLDEVGLNEEHLYRFPHEFSGGQRQRIGVARSIAVEPKLLVLDEPTSALDVSVQAQILNTLRDLQKSRGLSFLFISHNLSVIRMMSDRVAVMYLGKIVELAETDKLFETMLHPYTKSLLLSIPVPDPERKRKLYVLEGEIPSPSNPPKGCYFHPRCPEATRYCGWSPSDLAEPFVGLVDPFRNPEMNSLPKVESVTTDEVNNCLYINFESALVDNEAATETIRVLLKKEAAREKVGSSSKFEAISAVTVLSDGKTIQAHMVAPIIPSLKEVKNDHFVACILYDEDLPADAKATGESDEAIKVPR